MDQFVNKQRQSSATLIVRSYGTAEQHRQNLRKLQKELKLAGFDFDIRLDSILNSQVVINGKRT
jgi:hypothetical protein